jgi:hypothetical protein
MTEQFHLRVSTWKVFALGCACAGFFSFCAIMAWRSEQAGANFVFVPFIFMSMPAFLQTGPIEATPQALSLSTLVGRFEILWCEIDRIEYGQSMIVFFSGEKRMSISTPGWWSGPDRPLLHAAIHAAALDRDIEAE